MLNSSLLRQVEVGIKALLETYADDLEVKKRIEGIILQINNHLSQSSSEGPPLKPLPSEDKKKPIATNPIESTNPEPVLPMEISSPLIIPVESRKESSEPIPILLGQSDIQSTSARGTITKHPIVVTNKLKRFHMQPDKQTQIYSYKRSRPYYKPPNMTIHQPRRS